MTKRILVVDDEDDIREIAQVCLQTVGGYEVVGAASGAEGLAEAHARRPDAILLDVMMPGMDGPATFAKLQENESTRHIPVILLTARVQASDLEKFSHLGVSGVLAKPFDPMSLSSEVAEVLQWR